MKLFDPITLSEALRNMLSASPAEGVISPPTDIHKKKYPKYVGYVVKMQTI